jgi:hypothetical protein
MAARWARSTWWASICMLTQQTAVRQTALLLLGRFLQRGIICTLWAQHRVKWLDM